MIQNTLSLMRRLRTLSGSRIDKIVREYRNVSSKRISSDCSLVALTLTFDPGTCQDSQ